MIVKRKHLAVLGAVLASALVLGLLLGALPSRATETTQEPPAPKSEPQAEKQAAPSEPAAQPPQPPARHEPDDVGEATPAPIPGAVSIPMLSGPDLVVLPADPNKPRAEQVEWHYIPLFRVDQVKYTSENKILVLRLDPRLSAQTRARIQARLRELTSAPAQTAFRLNPVRIQALAVELKAAGKAHELYAEKSGHDIATGPVPLVCRIKDAELSELLASNLKDLAVVVRTTHPYAAFARSTMHVETSVSTAQAALEKVLPKGMKPEELEKRPLIVDRDSLVDLQKALREEFRVRIEGDPAKLAGLDRVFEKLLSDRVTASALPLHEISRELIDSSLVWNSRTQALDVSPSERKTITDEVETATKSRMAVRKVWELMREEARKAADAEAWHNTLHDKSKTNGEMSLGISIFSASASINVEKEFSKSDEGSKNASREHFAKMKDAGEMSEERVAETYRKFKGKDWERSSAGKVLNIQRVTNLNLLSFRAAIVEHVRRTNVGMLERVTLLPLEASDTQQADALREIELMKAELARLRTEFAQAKVEELGTMKPWLSNKLPKAWVWADGKSKFPKADWVPTHLRGATVPNMNEHLLGGTSDEKSVGLVYKDGSVGGQRVRVPVSLTAVNDFIGKHPTFPKQDIYGMIGVEGEAETRLMDFMDPGRGFGAYARRTFARIPQTTYTLGKQELTVPRTALDSASTNPRHVMVPFIIYLGE